MSVCRANIAYSAGEPLEFPRDRDEIIMWRHAHTPQASQEDAPFTTSQLQDCIKL